VRALTAHHGWSYRRIHDLLTEAGTTSLLRGLVEQNRRARAEREHRMS